MKKLLLGVFISLAIFVIWFVEPFSYNPFYKGAKITITSSVSSLCQPSNFAQADKLKVAQDKALNKYLSKAQFLGVATGVYIGSECITYMGAAGYSDKGKHTSFKPNTITRIASITKPMTAVAVMQLYEQGLIELDASLHTYLPNLPEAFKAITIKQLLSHTSGVPHYSSKLDAMSFSHFASLDKAVTTIVDRGLVAEPGSQYIYSSFGYTLLGKVIEQVTDLTFSDYMKQHIWQKAGMHNTSLETEQMGDNKTRLYIKAGPLYVRSPYTDLSIIYPGGGVQSTAGDLLKFGEAILKDTLISRDTLEIMIDVTDSLSPQAGDDPYGMGWSVYESATNGRIIAHGGAQPGASGHFQIWLDRAVVSVALSNAFGTKSSVYSLTNEIGYLTL